MEFLVLPLNVPLLLFLICLLTCTVRDVAWKSFLNHGRDRRWILYIRLKILLMNLRLTGSLSILDLKARHIQHLREVIGSLTACRTIILGSERYVQHTWCIEYGGEHH